MRVLVTRASPSAEKTAAKLAALGHTPVLLPLARAIHDQAAIKVALENAKGALVITSAEALRGLENSPETPFQRRLYAVGEATAKAARAAGFTDVHAAEGTGLSLAALIAGDLASTPHIAPLTYLAGSPRSPDLEAVLAAENIPMDVIEAYRMDAIEPDKSALQALLENPPQAVLLYSQESAQRFFRLSAVFEQPDRFSRTLFICISAKAASAVPPHFSPLIRIAEAPDEASLLKLLAHPSSQN